MAYFVNRSNLSKYINYLNQHTTTNKKDAEYIYYCYDGKPIDKNEFPNANRFQNCAHQCAKPMYSKGISKY